MCRETKLFVFLWLKDLNKCIKAYAEKQEAEAIPLKDASTDGNSRVGEVKLSVMMEVWNFRKDYILKFVCGT